MSDLKVLFLINGTETSAAAGRAQMLTRYFPATWTVQFNYRPAPKWQGILPFIQAALQFQPDIIYVMDTAYTGVLAGCLAKQWLGCQLITDTGDAAFELAKSTGHYSRVQLGLIYGIEQLAIQQSDFLIVRGSHHKSWLIEQGISKVECVPDGVDTKTIVPVDATELRQALGLDNALVVGLVGSMLWSERHRLCYGWDIIEALVHLQDVSVKGLLVGDGNGRTRLEERASQLGIRDRVVFTGQIPYQDLAHYLAAMDVCVSTQSNDRVGQVRTTGKLPLYLAYGKYVIATDVGEAKLVLPGVGCLLPYEGVRDDQHPLRLAVHLRNLVGEPALLQVSEQAMQTARTYFDYRMLAQRVETLLHELHNPTRP